MDNTNEDFNAKVINAIDAKTQWYDTTLLPHLQDEYRNHHILVRNLFDLLQKRSLITPDPYKHDKKISSIVCPEETPFNDNERNQKLGLRLSDYESMIDYICNYMKFSVAALTADKIKKLLEFNNSFTWNNMTPATTRPNSRALAICLSQLKSNQGMSVSMLYDGISKTATSIEEINKNLKWLGNFQRERYKGEVRKNIIASGKLKEESKTPNSMLSAIKDLFPSCMGKKPFSTDLVQEIVEEDTAPNKEELRAKLLDKLKIQEEKSKKKVNAVDTHELIMMAIRSIGSLAEQYNSVLEKFVSNHDVLLAANNNFKQKLLRLIRNVLGLSEPPVEYMVSITDHGSNQQRKELVNYKEFMGGLNKRTKYYSSITAKNSANYQRIDSQKDDLIFGFVNKQLTENGRLQVLLTALDDYFKASAPPGFRTKIKGIKMELTTLKNLLVKINQQKVEYAAYVEEAEQMKKLGIET